MNISNTLLRLIITAMLLGALAQAAAFSYHLSAGMAEAAAVNPIDLTPPQLRDETARLALMQTIAETYGITVADRAAQWTLDEVSSLKSGLDQIAGHLSKLARRTGPRMMRGLFKGVAFYRDHDWRGNIAYTIGGTVTFYDVWTRYDTVGRTFYLAHELGHVLDAQDSPLHLLLGDVSQIFAQNVDAYQDEAGVYHLGGAFPLHDRLRHRTDSAAEDWAESFATIVVPEFEADLRDIGKAREQEVKRLIILWTTHTFSDQQLQQRR